MIIRADMKIFRISDLLSIVSVIHRGGCLIVSLSTGSTPKLWAGGPSMMMLIHKICIALSGFGRLSTVDRVIRLKAEMLVLSWNRTKFFML